MKTRILLLLGIATIFSVFSCKDEGVDIEYLYYPEEDYQLISQYLNLAEVPISYMNDFPEYYSISGAVYNRDLATLGRVLFYDKNLSDDRSISCASCHKQEIGFSDDVAFSVGVNQNKTDRNSLALGSVFSFNEYYGPGRIPFFWDNRANTVQEQATATLGNPLEMNMELHQVMERVKEQPYYEPLFKAAFGRSVEDDEDILDAISEFVNSMGSFNSKYDQAVDQYLDSNGSLSNIKNADLINFDAQENVGRQLYLANCSSCHGNIEVGLGAPTLIEANNGLDVSYEDKGMGAISEFGSSYNGLFKVPTLRNVEKTGPYMHDGSLETLEDVIEHYSAGVQNHPNLSDELKQGNAPKQMNFSEDEKAALIAFLRTYTDEEFLVDEKYSDPFIR